MNQPQYLILYQKLKRKIVTGEFPEGHFLPSENSLASSFKVARSTVRQALQQLADDGYIIKKKGLRSVVNSTVKSLGLLSFKGFSDVVGKTSKNVNTQIIKGPVITGWMVDFFYNLTKEEIDAGCIYLERMRFVDNDPVMLEYTYIPNIDLPDFCKTPFVNNSLFQTLSLKHHIEINNLSQEIRAIQANDEVARWLMTGQGKPVLHIYRKYSTSRENFKIYSSLYCNTDRYAIGSNH
jgi:DNA-binding GntR family transcriptional regulator